jgi:hypothetical protein
MTSFLTDQQSLTKLKTKNQLFVEGFCHERTCLALVGILTIEELSKF